ncbi:839a626f-6f53-4d86-b2c2-d153829344b4 [Sclerotinia trifoliorum]|uniref:839a626f-6f53-4d86-b2c2-d153829344b4 n=1 Tax=Sclerotinia trifoliorum TaxID=28548 RepID=A0A8H2ZPT9_9HELO|nr:839a626f-6f53-4d86-b2c2-d153829344b4 [Sclerotinia trifoliorum]
MAARWYLVLSRHHDIPYKNQNYFHMAFIWAYVTKRKPSSVVGAYNGFHGMAGPGRSSYYGVMNNEFYSSSFNGFPNDINESIGFNHSPSPDFYLGHEIYFFPQMLGEQPYTSQPLFNGVAPIYEQLQSRSIVTGSTGARSSSKAQPSRVLDGYYRKKSLTSRKNLGSSQSHHVMEGEYYEHGSHENLEHSRKKRGPSEDKKRREPNIPQAHVFKLDLRIPLTSRPQSQSVASQESLSSVFHVNANQPLKRKARSAFTPEGKKKVEAVRSVGACVQCKFRKRTCGTSEPCMLCVRRAGSVESAASLCTRKSPFVELSISEFYSSGCVECITNFNVGFLDVDGQRRTIKVDGKGHFSSPLCLKVIEVQFSSLSEDVLEELRRITIFNSRFSSQQDARLNQPGTVTILDSKFCSSIELENWVMEYTYHNKLDDANSTSFLFGVAYAKEQLPHADLVRNTTKLVAFSDMLCKGLKITAIIGEQDMATHYSALRAQLETKLFNLLYNAESLVYQELQRLVFKTSGQLAKDATLPVALVLWLLTRLQSLKTSHLINSRERKKSPSHQTTASYASHQKHSLNLLTSVFTALFRSSFPLLMDFEDERNRDLLGGNEDLIQLSKKLRRDLIAFKRRGYLKAWTWNGGFLKDQVDRLRDILTE